MNQVRVFENLELGLDFGLDGWWWWWWGRYKQYCRQYLFRDECFRRKSVRSCWSCVA